MIADFGRVAAAAAAHNIPALQYSEDAKPNDELNAFNERIRMAER
jgi:hypothetical protein